MKIITHADIVKLHISPLQCYEWVFDMLMHKSNAILPVKISMKPMEGVFYNVMPSLLPKCSGGVKVVTRYPFRNPALDSQILLYDYETGNVKALLDGNYITAMRTGAVAAHSIGLLGKQDFKEIGMIGLGNQARAVIKVILALYPNRKFILKLLKYKNQHLLFEDYFKDFAYSGNIEFISVNSYKEAVRGSDVIISSATYFSDDICDKDCFDEGCLVVPIHTRGFMNCDIFFDKIYADDTEHVKGFKYFNQFKRFAEISDVLIGEAEGRINDVERIIVYNIGLSMHDINFAERIYEIAQIEQAGQEIKLSMPKEKFWI